MLQNRHKTFRHIVKTLGAHLPQSTYSASCFLSHARPRRIARSVNNYYYYYYYYDYYYYYYYYYDYDYDYYYYDYYY